MARRAPLLLSLAVAIALALVPVAAAVTVQIGNGDTVDVVGTKIACFILPNKEKGVGCFLASNKGLTVGTYGIGLSQKGDVVITKVNTKGAAVTLWAGRAKTSARAHAIRYFQLKAGDSFGFKVGGVDVGCTVIDISTGGPKYSGRRVVCFRSNKTKPIPNTWGVVVSNKFAGSFRFDAKRHIGPTAFVRFQPK